jgi:VIT1/CCC1 family predicted Fe2+/Mn2+ transporter
MNITEQILHHTKVDPHRGSSFLSDVILGGQDGIVNVLGVILGIAAATGDSHVVIVAGLAATFAESVSMAAVAYTSTLAEADYYESERERELRHIQEVPKIEKDEVRELYSRKGFRGDLLDRIVDTITANKDVWVAVMMAEEHQLIPIKRKGALRSAVIVGISAIIGSLIPIIPFFFLPMTTAMLVSVAITALTLFIVGAYKARIYVGNPGRSGLEMAAIGTVSALVGYLIGLILRIKSS